MNPRSRSGLTIAVSVGATVLLAAALAVPASAATQALVEISHLGPDTVVTEGGPTDIYLMRLLVRPTADVIVTVEPRGDVALSSNTLVFTPSNFNSYQGLLVSALNDTHTEVTETVFLHHRAASGDPNFNGAALFQPSERHPVVILDNDRSPRILVPTEGACLTASDVTFRGIGGRLQTLAIFIDDIPEVLATVGMDEMWTTSAIVADGEHIAVAKDSDGRVSPPVSFVVDTVEPTKPVITSPAAGDTVGASVTVEGTADPGAAIVLTDGASATLGTTTADGAGGWSLDVTYAASGPQTLLAATSDCGVTVVSDAVEFTVDAAPPAITIRSTSGLQIAPGEALTVEGVATDPAGVREVSVILIDPITGAHTPAQVACSGCSTADVSWVAEAQSLPGRYDIVVTAVDRLGNTATETITLVKI